MAFITVCQYIFMWVRFTERRSAVLEAGDLQQAIHDIKRQGGPEMNDA
jgi:hypothetical protein